MRLRRTSPPPPRRGTAADALTEAARLRAWLVIIVEEYQKRAVLFRDDADCAGALADRACLALGHGFTCAECEGTSYKAGDLAARFRDD